MPDNYFFWVTVAPEVSLRVDFVPEGLAFTLEVVVVDAIIYWRFMTASRRGAGVFLVQVQVFIWTWHPVYGGRLSIWRQLRILFLTPTVPGLPTERFWAYQE